VIAAIKRTRIKFAFDRIACGRNGIEIIPAIGNRKDKKSNKKSGINFWYGCYFIAGRNKYFHS
jgi:hypothetical protein